MNPLEHFEIGYDRHYIGTALHCLLCPPDENTIREDLHGEIDDGDRLTLADVAATAEAHHDAVHVLGHSTACGTAPHVHGYRCAGDCPTCNAAAGKGPPIVADVDAYHARMQQLRAERAALERAPIGELVRAPDLRPPATREQLEDQWTVADWLDVAYTDGDYSPPPAL